MVYTIGNRLIVLDAERGAGASSTDDWLALQRRRDEEQAFRSGPAFSDLLKHMSLKQLVEQLDRRRGAPS